MIGVDKLEGSIRIKENKHGNPLVRQFRAWQPIAQGEIVKLLCANLNKITISDFGKYKDENR